MGTLQQKLQYLADTKQAIRTAIENKGVTVEDTDTFRSYANKIADIETGGGSTDFGTGKYTIKVFDYDGSLIDYKHCDNGFVYTLPTPPTHSRLVFQEWTCSQEITNNTVIVDKANVFIAPIYTTTSGATEVDVRVVAGTTSFDLSKITDDVTINWGDGVSGIDKMHTYLSYGDFTIKIYGLRDVPLFMFNQGSSAKNQTVKRIFLSSSCISFSARYYDSLETITIPRETTVVKTVDDCPLLTCFFYPANTDDSYLLFANDYSLNSVILSKQNNYINAGGFKNCYSLKNLVLPANKQKINSNVFFNCYSLKKLQFLGSITRIENSAFYYNGTERYEFLRNTAVAVLATSSCFIGRQSSSKIIVPDSLYNSWKYTTNWIYWAQGQIIPESEDTE